MKRVELFAKPYLLLVLFSMQTAYIRSMLYASAHPSVRRTDGSIESGWS